MSTCAACLSSAAGCAEHRGSARDQHLSALLARGYHVTISDRGHDVRVMLLRNNEVPLVHYAATADEAVASAYAQVCAEATS